MAPQLLSEPIQKLNEANGQRELPKTGTTKTPFMLIAGILASTFAVLGVSYLQIRKINNRKAIQLSLGAFLLSGDKLLIGANQKLCYSKVSTARKGGSK